MAVYQDGTAPTGAPVLSINSVNYICDSFEESDEATTQNQNNENGEHARSVSFKGPSRFTAVLQLASSSTAYPTTAAANSTTGVFAHNSANYFIDKIGKPRAAQGIWLVNIEGQKKVN